MLLQDSPHRTLLPTTPTYNYDVATLGVPALLAEEMLLRREFAGRRQPTKAAVERLAAVECALAREGGAR